MAETCFKCGRELVPTCPECGEPVDLYSRVVGYLRPVATWNDGKQEEFKDRKEYLFWNGDHTEREEIPGHCEPKITEE